MSSTLTDSNPRMHFSIFRKIASPRVAELIFLKKCIAPAAEGLNFGRAALNGPKTYYLYIASIPYFMKVINHLREFYGFPQAVLAQYVGVSRGHLSMAAIGRKDLQTAAFLKLIKLALAVKTEDGPEQEDIKASHRTLLKDKEAGFVNYKILETEHRLMGCQRKLHRMQVKHRQAIHSLACLAVLQADPEDPDINHYKVMEMSTRKLLDKNSEVAQLDLELRIAGLKATAEFLQQRVAARESQAAAQANREADNTMPRFVSHETEMCFV